MSICKTLFTFTHSTNQIKFAIMKNLLFPHRFRLIGWLLFVPATVMGVLCYLNLYGYSGVSEIIANDAIIIGIALGALFIVCSKEPKEDEMTRSIRMAALLNSLYVYVALLVTSTLLLNGLAFWYFMVANLVLLPIIYVIVFRLEMYRYNKMSIDEE